MVIGAAYEINGNGTGGKICIEDTANVGNVLTYHPFLDTLSSL